MNDDQIIKLFFTRNEDAIQQTAYKYGTRLQSMAVNIVQDTQDAEESVNDTYLKAWDTIPPTKPGHFFAYLAKICRYISFGKLEECSKAQGRGSSSDAGDGRMYSRLLAGCANGKQGTQPNYRYIPADADTGKSDDLCPPVLVCGFRFSNCPAV